MGVKNKADLLGVPKVDSSGEGQPRWITVLSGISTNFNIAPSTTALLYWTQVETDTHSAVNRRGSGSITPAIAGVNILVNGYYSLEFISNAQGLGAANGAFVQIYKLKGGVPSDTVGTGTLLTVGQLYCGTANTQAGIRAAHPYVYLERNDQIFVYASAAGGAATVSYNQSATETRFTVELKDITQRPNYVA